MADLKDSASFFLLKSKKLKIILPLMFLVLVKILRPVAPVIFPCRNVISLKHWQIEFGFEYFKREWFHNFSFACLF